MPHRSRTVVAALALAAGCFGHTSAPPYDPFRTPRVQVAATMRVVALAPMKVPKDLESADFVKARFLATVDAQLREAGLVVVPAPDVGPVVDAVFEARGGFFDPKTGQVDEAKLLGARKEVVDRLAAKFGRVDGIVFTDLRVVNARVVRDSATWDHASEWAATSSWKSLLNKHSGSLRALTVVVRVTGRDGRDVYVDAGGVQLLEKVDVSGNRVPVPMGELLADEQRNRDAVVLATAALAEAVREGRAAPGALPPAPAQPAPAPPAIPAQSPAAAPRTPPGSI